MARRPNWRVCVTRGNLTGTKYTIKRGGQGGMRCCILTGFESRNKQGTAPCGRSHCNKNYSIKNANGIRKIKSRGPREWQVLIMKHYPRGERHISGLGPRRKRF